MDGDGLFLAVSAEVVVPRHVCPGCGWYRKEGHDDDCPEALLPEQKTEQPGA